MQDRVDIPSKDAFDAHATAIRSKVVDIVKQAADAAEQKGFGDLLDFGIVNLPFAGGAAVMAGDAKGSIAEARDGIEKLAEQIQQTGAAYHENDAEVASILNKFISDQE
ncbi:hypothetical protein [Glycomyces sp. NRRL B-16210]|uniref:hypothetical protein n=1 Tax=Glycomyces sp. NRRL B-16210 TaxID=1463821 RepID=UPI0004C20376|nr:hypothetical protein [Glycomyces sp. NRRL B-16210]